MIVPKLTLDLLYGTAPIYSARASDRRCRWLLQDPLVRDALAGGLLAMAGSLETLCSQASVTPACRDLLARAGLPAPGPVQVFDGPEDYVRRLQALSRERPVVVHHRHAPEELPDERYWIPRRLLSELNDKARLEAWVPAAQVPRRHVLPLERLREPLPLPLPVVVKVASEDSSGGGFGVCHAATPAALAAARDRLAGAPSVVVEERLDFERSVCLHYGVARDGTVTFLAGADQVIGADGHHDGNWLRPDRPLPKEAVDTGLAVCGTAWRRGYHGLAGLDVLLLRDGTHRVVDLNFRVNASSGAALVWDAVRARRGDAVARVRRFRLPGGMRAASGRLARWIDAGRLLPLALCDPERGAWRGQPAWMHALVLGESPADVARWLEEAGLPEGRSALA